ncbi:MAG: phage tail protein [Nitrospira sp.]
MPARTRNADPYLAARFTVEIDGRIIAGFSEVNGLQVEIESEEYQEGGLNDYVHHFSGKVRYPSRIVLKRGFADNRAIWDWQSKVMQGQVQRKNVSIILQDEQGSEKARWNVAQALPVKWSGPDFRASAAEVAVETLELVHCGFSRA